MQFFALLVLVCVFVITAATQPTTVSTLDVSKYTGLWFQMYADQIVLSTFEKDNYCVTAQYGDNFDGTLSVHNYATLGANNGPVTVIDGYAYIPDASQPGQLKVHFDTGSPVDGQYWVLELGPINAKGEYDWSIVSDSKGQYLFVLARDPVNFKATYDKDVQAKLEAYGFTGFNKPIPTYQEADCVYESALRTMQIKSNADKEMAAKKMIF